MYLKAFMHDVHKKNNTITEMATVQVKNITANWLPSTCDEFETIRSDRTHIVNR